MASKIYSFVVLMPNGRRQTLKVNLDSSVLQILEDVCLKHGFNSQEYALKHHNTVLDPASVVRFCSLPNNAFLEMVPSKKQADDPSCRVFLSLQVDGETERITGEFPSDSNLECILVSMYPKCIENDSSSLVPVIVYMRREVVGFDNLKVTTLRSLGLTSGRALLRLTMRKSEEHPELRCSGNFQINRSFSLQSKGVSEAKDSASHSRSQSEKMEEKHQHSITSCLLSDRRPTFPSQSIPAAEIVTAAQLVDNLIDSVKVDKSQASSISDQDNISRKSKTVSPSRKEKKTAKVSILQEANKEQSGYSEPSSSMEVEENERKNPLSDINLDNLKYLDEHNGLVFPLQDSGSSLNIDVPDSFFEVTLDDLKLMMRDLKRTRELMENAPLQTEALRELDRQSKSRKYTKTVLRIQFPDRYILQGVFNASDTVAHVAAFVRNYLRNPNLEFCLYTSPPKKILSFEETLLDAGCVPSAKIYFSYTDQTSKTCVSSEYFLHEKVLPFVTSQDIASIAAGQIRRNDSKKVTKLVGNENSAV